MRLHLKAAIAKLETSFLLSFAKHVLCRKKDFLSEITKNEWRSPCGYLQIWRLTIWQLNLEYVYLPYSNYTFLLFRIKLNSLNMCWHLHCHCIYKLFYLSIAKSGMNLTVSFTWPMFNEILRNNKKQHIYWLPHLIINQKYNMKAGRHLSTKIEIFFQQFHYINS